MALNIIGYAYGRAANNPSCEDGPSFIQGSAILKTRNLSTHWLKTLHSEDPHQGLMAQKAVAKLNAELALDVHELVKKGLHFLTLGGDHSSAIGTWSGAASALDTPLGLLWIDAHLDSNTPQTSISKNIHGMPLAVLLGHGEPELTSIQTPNPKISPENLVLVGPRSFEEKESELLKNLGVRIFTMEDVRRDGLEKVLQAALSLITAHTKNFGISLDLDAIDPKEAPGVGCPEPNGITASELLKGLKTLAEDPRFIGAEIAEFNPSLDKDQKTEELIVDLIEVLC